MARREDEVFTSRHEFLEKIRRGIALLSN